MDAQEVEASALQFMQEATAGRTLKGELIAAAIVGVLLALAIGGTIVWSVWPAKPLAEVMTPAPAVRQADGSMEAARAPDAHPAPPPHMIPKGYHEVSRDAVTVAPSPAAAASGCPPVRVDLSVVRDGNDQRVIASSPDGQVVSAINIPIEAAQLPPPNRPWAAGLSYDTRHATGIWVDRDIGGRLRVGAAVQRLQDGRVEAQIRAGIRW